jgi:hypothetical protein
MRGKKKSRCFAKRSARPCVCRVSSVRVRL